VGLRGPAEMLGVAVLPCQIFLKETVIGSVRHTSEKLLKTLKIGSLIRQKNGMIRPVRQEYRHSRCWCHKEGWKDWPLIPVLAASSWR